MTTYCYVCPECGVQDEFPRFSNVAGILCDDCGVLLRRDWKAENATFTRIPGGNR